jgi:hypothetical protein
MISVLPPPTPRLHSAPLPSQIETPFPAGSPIVLHPAITYTGNILDLYLDVSRGTCQLHRYPQSNLLFDAVTHPSLPSIAVIHPLLPWPIIAHSQSSLAGVTIADLFQAIYGSLQQEITGHGANVTLFPRTMTTSGRRRKMVSLLGGRHRLMGLSQIPGEESTFVLHVTSV